MAVADFEEKTYETAYNAELAYGIGGNRLVFSPGQVLEKLTGFDAAHSPGSAHLIWQVLGLPRPRGVRLVPEHWPKMAPKGDQLPTYPLSLILQFKRAEYLYGARAKQWNLWGGAYYRFQRQRYQHQVLRKLDVALAGKAVVRYAAPAFHTLRQLEAAQMQGRVIARSGHVSPEAMGKHAVWTYQTAGTVGRGNPNGPEVMFESFGQLLEDFVQTRDSRPAALVQYQGLSAHLAAVADACRSRAPRVRRAVAEWAGNLNQARPPFESVQPLVDYFTIQAVMSWYQMSWWVIDGLPAARQQP
ncbi:hypothetical protein [Kribbella sp. NPDC004875]|uniref:hypothetical protein n=1 Tax=Kribbella sp. NPDC004875 TaxID=3364107 RepID=UPI0036996E82